MAQGTDKIFLDGEEVNSADWNEKVFTSPGKTTVKIVSEVEGKNPTEYVFNIYKNEISFDYENETIIYDRDAYTVKDENGNILASDSSVSDMIKNDEATLLTVTPADGGEEFVNFIPSRFEIEPLRIAYMYNIIYKVFDGNYMVSTNPDMSDAVYIIEQPDFLLTPGVDLYIQRNATYNDFKSQIYHLDVPQRPTIPEVNVEKISSTSVTLQSIDGAMYSSSPESEWQPSPVFTDLAPGTKYRFGVALQATYHSFMSEVYVVEVTTKNPDDYELGDVNMDEEINILDVSLIQKFLVNLVSASDEFDKSLADYNQDGKVSIIDATYIQIYTSRK